jgi:hypothetical protein
MGRILKQEDGLYHVKGKTFSILKGSRAQVGHDTAYKTSGKLTKKDLFFNGKRWVSLCKHKSAKSRNRLLEHGYGTRKGHFGMVEVAPRKSRKSRKIRN